ncbi:MAG: LysR family transcriptional regulator [Alphaproteobacteria bacterium]|nr:LysR family transcriptional regulator [Alphaproteobacteria bacterium]
MTAAPWDDIRAFLAVADAGSFAKAARATKLSEATLGRHVKALEAHLDAPLFDRLPNALRLTALGREALEGARAMEAGATTLDRRAKIAREPAQRPVVVSSVNSIAWFLVRNMAALKRETGEVLVTLTPTRNAVNLARREADIALRMLDLPDAPDLAGRKVAVVANAIYASHAYLAEHRRRPADGIDGIDFIMRETGSERSPQARFSAAIAPRVRTVLRVSETVLRHQAAVDGMGATLLPCHLGDGDARLARIGDPVPELLEDMYLIVHRDMRRVALVRGVADALVRLFKRNARVLAGR